MERSRKAEEQQHLDFEDFLSAVQAMHKKRRQNDEGSESTLCPILEPPSATVGERMMSLSSTADRENNQQKEPQNTVAATRPKRIAMHACRITEPHPI